MIAIIACVLSVIATATGMTGWMNSGWLDAKGYVLTWVSGLLAGVVLVVILLALSEYVIGG